MSSNNLKTPLISIIVPSHNNYPAISAALFSLVFQTMTDIEIIVVDNGSTDGTSEFLTLFAMSEPRLRILAFRENLGQHMARKSGVALANGSYIMFMDADDSFTPNACEIAFKAISRGYDMVFFNAQVFSAVGNTEEELTRMRKVCNGLEAGIYSRHDLLTKELLEKQYMHNLWNKIINAEICKKSFASMADGFFVLAEDFYEFNALLFHSVKILKINVYLYNYNFGQGVTIIHPDNLAFRHSHLLKPFEALCAGHDAMWLYPYFREILAQWSIGLLFRSAPENFADFLLSESLAFGEKFYNKIFIRMSLRSGNLPLSLNLPFRYANEDQFGICLAVSARNFSRIRPICDFLLACGYDLHLLMTEPHECNDTDVERYKINIIPVVCQNHEADAITFMQNYLKINKIAVLIADFIWSNYLYFQILFPQLIGCKIILLHIYNNMSDWISRRQSVYLDSFIKISALPITLITSSYGENVFMRMFGMNTFFLNFNNANSLDICCSFLLEEIGFKAQLEASK